MADKEEVAQDTSTEECELTKTNKKIKLVKIGIQTAEANLSNSEGKILNRTLKTANFVCASLIFALFAVFLTLLPLLQRETFLLIVKGMVALSSLACAFFAYRAFLTNRSISFVKDDASYCKRKLKENKCQLDDLEASLPLIKGQRKVLSVSESEQQNN
ncbi:hypothetical protein VCHA53O466_50046 [Vibrio chagasii]|nr:hypothetical protein VCHA53O466_50046 [Vibrio chagasii]